MKNLYKAPYIDFVLIDSDIITTSPPAPDFDEDENELPKQDW